MTPPRIGKWREVKCPFDSAYLSGKCLEYVYREVMVEIREVMAEMEEQAK